MTSLAEFPEADRGLRDEIAATTARRLGALYTDRDRRRFKIPEPDARVLAGRMGIGVADSPAVQWALDALRGMVMPGYFCSTPEAPKGDVDLVAELRRVADIWYGILKSFFDRRSLMLVDFKIEFGKHDRSILIADEVSPDTCRIWDRKTNKKMDKDRFRYDMGRVDKVYQELLERIISA